MAVSEAQQLFASSLAYVDLDKAFEELSQNTPGPVTLKAALQYAQENGVKMGDFSRFLENGNLKKEYKYAEDWVITAVVNQNTTNVVDPTGAPANTGLYACIFDTGEANILACRGSEGQMKDLMHYRQDWYNADFKLLNSTMTTQEEALEAFMTKHAHLLGSKPWVSTGHSLGGALADYAAIMSIKLGIDNYDGTIDFDGPGHSEEFIQLYSDEIAQICDKMLHKKASMVGHFLNDLPGVRQECIATKDVECFDRHLIKNWDLDENQETKPGEPRWYETTVGNLTRYIDWLPAPVGNLMVWLLNLGFEAKFWLTDLSNEHPLIFKTLLFSVLAIVLNSFLMGYGLSFLGCFIGCTFLLLGGITLGKLLFDGMEWLLRETIDAICNVVSWLKGKAVELYHATMEFIRSIPQYLHSLTPGSKYANSNPYFRADPALLRDYARRLAAVNARLMSLDRDLDQLYLQVGLLDVRDIFLSNIITTYSARLGLARNYLNSAADALENADNQALRYMGG